LGESPLNSPKGDFLRAYIELFTKLIFKTPFGGMGANI